MGRGKYGCYREIERTTICDNNEEDQALSKGHVMNAANASVAMSGQLNFDLLISDMGGARVGCEDSVTYQSQTVTPRTLAKIKGQ